MGQDSFGQDGSPRKSPDEDAPAGTEEDPVMPDEVAADDAPASAGIGAEPRSFDPADYSNLIVRTIDGLRVAIAGLPDDMPVEIEGVVLDAMSVGELRALARLPDPLRIIIPYRLLSDSRVHVQRAEDGERGL